MFTFNINGKTLEADAEPGTPMLWVVRDDLDLTGTKYGCGIAACGACTVLVDGVPVRSCQLVAEQAVGKKITTIEGLNDEVADAVQQAWRKIEVSQCGYCQSGMILLAYALLKKNKTPTEADINSWMNVNVCRCGSYHRIRLAIQHAARKLGG